MATCEACGAKRAGSCRYAGCVGKSEADILHAALCNDCAIGYGPNSNGELAAAIRARRSAPQQAQVLSAEGKPIAVGDRIVNLGNAAGVVTGFKNDFDGDLLAEVNGDDGSQWTCCPRYMRHVAAPAQPPGAEVACGECCSPQHEGPCKTPGGSADAATKAEGLSGQGEQAFASAQPPGASLAAFTAAVEAHLLPRLPSKLRLVFDAVTNRYTSRCVPVCWVLDERGAELHSFSGWPFEDDHAASVAGDIARILMSRLARPASELERGRGK